MRMIGKILRLAADGVALLGALALILMMLQVSLDVILKNLFDWPVPFTHTLVTKWYMVAAAFLPLALTEVLDRHIAVELAYQRLPSRGRRILGGAVCLYAGVVTAVMTWPLWGEALKRMAAGTFILESGEPMEIWQAYFFLPLGFGLFSLTLFYRAAILWSGVESGMGETRIDRDADGADAHVGAEV